ncbi:hypothetical protein [Microbacterium sp. RURRCA19A]|uniref:hypothetical protein n=1 Tax=Microbacterium sp. RURRCA19A TaxID=1907391 RepID=UPI000970ADCC|nr:hypothetical protein [Microbacterium sp. RURRCA19A]
MDVGWWALILSGASLLVSSATYWRNRTATPRWVTDIAIKEDSDGELRVTGTVANRGRGAARDVRFEQEGDRLLSASSRRTAERMEFGDKMSITLIYRPGTVGTAAFVLSWSQEPNLHRRRSRRLRYSVGHGRGRLPEPKRELGIEF